MHFHLFRLPAPFPASHRRQSWLTVAYAFALLACGGASQAQVQVLSQPYRAPAPSSQQLPSIPFVSAQNATTTVTSVATATPQRWEVLSEDQKLSRALWRWTQQEGIQFFWEAPNDLLAVKASYAGSFATAVLALMEDTASSAYPLRACRYDNALRIIHTSKTCTAK